MGFFTSDNSNLKSKTKFWKPENWPMDYVKGMLQLGFIWKTVTLLMFHLHDIFGALHDLVPFVQIKKCEKHPWRSVNFVKINIGPSPNFASNINRPWSS